MRMFIVIVALIFCPFFTLKAQAANIDNVNRVRIIMDLIKDNEVTALANYASVDLLDGNTALKYGEAMYYESGFTKISFDNQNVVPWSSLTNTQRATYIVNNLRAQFIDWNKRYEARTAGDSAYIAAKDAAQAQGEADLGTEEAY